MVLPDSRGVPRVPRYSGTESEDDVLSPTGPLPTSAELSRSLRLGRHCCNFLDRSGGPDSVPQPRQRNAPELARHRFGLIPVRSPLLGESLLLSLPEGT